MRSKQEAKGKGVPGSHMACAGDLKQAKNWLAQSIFPCVACACHTSSQHTAI